MEGRLLYHVVGAVDLVGTKLVVAAFVGAVDEAMKVVSADPPIRPVDWYSYRADYV
jgi:hypothetical protein